MAKRTEDKRFEEISVWVTLGLLVVCFAVGLINSQADLSEVKHELWPHAASFEALGTDSVSALDARGEVMGYVYTGTYAGFGGPLRVAVGVERDGSIRQVKVLEHRESPSWYARVMQSDVLKVLAKKSYRDPIKVGDDVDGVTGATYTTRAIVHASKEAVLAAAKEALKLDISAYIEKRRIQFGWPEASLLFLLIAATLSASRVPKRHRTTLKWTLMILGATLLGFAFNHPLTLVDVNKLIMGYWPDVYTQLYWYILIFGIAVIFLTTGHNAYCEYVCPFGAVQECAAKLTGAKGAYSKKYSRTFNWARRFIVLLAIMLALIYRNPGMSSYEVYGTLFNLLGTNTELFFLTLVLGAALLMKRPWCRYLCPIPVIEHYARFIYKRLKSTFVRLRPRKA